MHYNQPTDATFICGSRWEDTITEIGSKQYGVKGVWRVPFKVVFLAAAVLSTVSWLLLLGSGIWWLILKI